MYDVIIVGSGPAGMSAAIYAKRACLKTLLLEKQPMGGGQVLNTQEVENYPGIPLAGGFELGQKFEEHAKALGAEVKTEEVTEINCLEAVKKVKTAKGEYEAKVLIYAAGASHRKLSVPGEEEFAGRGVSYCATCDGAFFRNKTTAVIGGGDTALSDALVLAKGCKKVFLIHRRDAFRGSKTLQNRVEETENIEIILDSVVTEIRGEAAVREISVSCVKTKDERILSVDGVFAAVGILPYTKLLEGQADLDEQGYVVAGEDCRTSVDGVYAAGDVRTKPLRQIVTAAADGANAAAAAERYLTLQKD